MILALMIICTSSMVLAQNTEYDKQKAIYEKALSYNDYNVATNALYHMMVLKPSNKGLLDTLAYLYYERQQYVSAAIAAQEAAKINPGNALALEIAATSFESIGLNDKALEHYELLYLKNNDISTLYKMAFIQYRMKRFNDARASADIIINDAKAREIKLVFNKRDKSRQEIPMIAAAYRLKGLIAYEKKETDKAIQMLEKSLEFAPDFDIVKDAVEQIKKQ